MYVLSTMSRNLPRLLSRGQISGRLVVIRVNEMEPLRWNFLFGRPSAPSRMILAPGKWLSDLNGLKILLLRGTVVVRPQTEDKQGRLPIALGFPPIQNCLTHMHPH